jgi:hypothetical protein
MGLISLSSGYFYIPGMKKKGQAKQNTKKELKEMLNWMSSTENCSTG